MKASKYNVFFNYKGKDLAFNGITSAFAEVDEDFCKVMRNIDSLNVDNVDKKTKKLIEEMKLGFFIVDKEVDELNLLKFNSLSGKFSSHGLVLTIAPTLVCNFACPYCYEGSQNGVIEKEVIDAIYARVEAIAKKKEPISITWYGGEPLLVKDIIWKMSEKLIEICKKRKAPYSSYMISNGYLINDNIIEQMKKAQITGIQITVDGPPDIHNSRRKLKNSSEPTFNVILEHIKMLTNAGVSVNVRVNIDKTNQDDLEELLDIFIEEGLQDCDIALGHVRDYTTACAAISGTCLTTKEYAEESHRYQNVLLKKGFTAVEYPYYPGAKANYCCADSLTAFVVDPQGNLYKCWNDIGNAKRRVGNLKEEKNFGISNLFFEYLLWSPFDKQTCVDCEVLPLCMGGCPYNGLRNKKPDCEKWKYNLLDVLKTRYDIYCTQEEKEGKCEHCAICK
ncbi:MAG: radical SAM/SPASM domain Clo7bot peptide maturase [Oscillospiraceae bacterium]|jgi:uncharacterized protein|nr:radical SAM/SPASM domain Clo7bot peptide maturase [Oscillospiraceae bacterium]